MEKQKRRSNAFHQISREMEIVTSKRVLCHKAKTVIEYNTGTTIINFSDQVIEHSRLFRKAKNDTES